MEKPNNNFTERRVYKFTCAGCGRKHAQSFKKSVAQRHRCRKCRYVRAIDDRQSTLFEGNTGTIEQEYTFKNGELQKVGGVKVTVTKVPNETARIKGVMSRLQ